MRKLNVNQKLFCKVYMGQECFGNATRAYLIAYKIKGVPLDTPYKWLKDSERKKYISAGNSAQNLLKNTYIKERCNELLDAMIKDEVVDRELARVIQQNKELNPKVQAIREYNKLKKRVSDDINLKVPQTLIDIIKSATQKNDKPNKTTGGKE